jgi:hypothetical protein
VPQPRLHRDEFSVPGPSAWEKTVNKMIKVYGAPLSDEDAAAIVSYLDQSYGK